MIYINFHVFSLLTIIVPTQVFFDETSILLNFKFSLNHPRRYLI